MEEQDPPQLSPEDQAKAKRALTILYTAMTIFAILPFIVYFVFKA